MTTQTSTEKKAAKIAVWMAALDRAENGQSMMNYDTIYDGFEEMGIDPDEIEPRENVLTYNAWQAKGRQVRKGQHGVKITVFVPATKRGENGEPDRHFKISKLVAVFHISQTQKSKH